MKKKRILIRMLVSASVVMLAACQTTPTGTTAADAAAPATQQATPASAQKAPESQQAREGGAPLAVFLADTQLQDGWQPVQLSEGMLYLHPEPVIVRDDLTGVQAGANKEGDGLLALELGPDGQSKITQVTTQFPNKRLALIVGQTMLAAPGYTTPVTTQNLVFVVGTEQNAMAAARAIAGVGDGSGEAVVESTTTMESPQAGGGSATVNPGLPQPAMQ